MKLEEIKKDLELQRGRIHTINTQVTAQDLWFFNKNPEIIAKLVKQVEVMKEALAFYANRDAYNQTAKVWEDMWADSGSKARAALKALEEIESCQGK